MKEDSRAATTVMAARAIGRYKDEGNRIDQIDESMKRKKFTEAGLTDRSERPTTHRLLAPMERRKEREERLHRARKGRSSH